MVGKYDDFFEELIWQNNGYLHISLLEKHGVDRAYVYPYIKERKLKKLARGMYCTQNTKPDMMFVVCRRNSAAIISHLSAAFVHGLISEEPERVTITVPQGYNALHLTDNWINVIQVKKELLPVGKTMAVDGYKNNITLYDKERTMCDLIREREYVKMEGEEQIGAAIRNYFATCSEDSLKKLVAYSSLLGIKKKVLSYISLFS